MSKLEEIEVPVWVVRGSMMIRRDALEADDPDHTYNYVKRVYNIDPTDFGIPKPPSIEICPHCGGKLSTREP